MATARKSRSAALAAFGVMLALVVPSARAASIGGVVPDQPTGTPSPRAPRVFGAVDLGYQGGPVMHTNRTHLIFWNPSGSFTWDQGYQQLMIQFLTDVAADSHKSTNVYSLTGQYYDNTQNPPVRAEYDSTYAGAVQVTDVPPRDTDEPRSTTTDCTMPTVAQGGPGWTSCITNAQIGAEVRNVVTSRHLPTGLTDIYFVVMPNGVGSCVSSGPDNCSLGGSALNGFCGFHTSLDLDGTHYLYADLPYNDVPPHCRSAGFPQPNGSTADITISTLSHEHNETITNPLPGSEPAWINADGNENGDLCAGSFGPALGSTQSGAYNEAIGSGHYYTQEEWSNEDGGCAARDEADTVDFSSNAPRPPGTPVTFTSRAVDPDGSIVSTRWDFGDGSGGASGTPATHVFAHSGVYQVTLHTVDIGGQWDWVTKSVIVDTPPSASFTAVPASPVARQTVTFNASGSSDSDGSIVSYRWAFGDGAVGSGAASTHAFARAGTFDTMLTVTDNFGLSSTSTRRIRVAPPPRGSTPPSRGSTPPSRKSTPPSRKSTPPPHVSISLKARALRIAVNEPGKIGVGSKWKRVTRPGTVTFKLTLSRRQRKRLSSGHAVTLRLKITFVPRVGATVTRSITVTIHP